MSTHTFTPDGNDDDDPVVGYCYYSRNGMVAHIYCTGCVDDHSPTNTKVSIRPRPVYGSAVPHLQCDDCGDRFTEVD